MSPVRRMLCPLVLSSVIAVSCGPDKQNTTLDVASLAPGAYTLTLSVTAPVALEVTREVEVVP